MSPAEQYIKGLVTLLCLACCGLLIASLATPWSTEKFPKAGCTITYGFFQYCVAVAGASSSAEVCSAFSNDLLRKVKSGLPMYFLFGKIMCISAAALAALLALYAAVILGNVRHPSFHPRYAIGVASLAALLTAGCWMIFMLGIDSTLVTEDFFQILCAAEDLDFATNSFLAGFWMSIAAFVVLAPVSKMLHTLYSLFVPVGSQSDLPLYQPLNASNGPDGAMTSQSSRSAASSQIYSA